MKLNNLILTALSLLLVFLIGINLQLRTGYSYITVTGTSTQKQQNKIATFTASVTETNEDKSVVNEIISQKSESIVKALESFGIPKENIQTTNVSIYQMEQPRIVSGQTTYEPGDWRATVSVEIRLEDTERADELVNLLSSLDISDMYGPRFSRDQEETPSSDLLKSAYDDAYSKAEFMAKSLGKKVDKAMEITEGGTVSNSLNGIFEARGMGGGGADIPLEPGSTQISKTVTVRFRLK